MEVVSGHSIAHREGLLLTLIKINKDVLIDDENETESLLHLFQAMEFQCKFDLMPVRYQDRHGNSGDLGLIVNEIKLLF